MLYIFKYSYSFFVGKSLKIKKKPKISKKHAFVNTFCLFLAVYAYI